MWKATIRGLLARRVRLVLTAMAVLLGVSFVSATYVLTDTVRRSFDAVFAQTLAGVDLQVQGLRPLGTRRPAADPRERARRGSRRSRRRPRRGLRHRATRSSSVVTARASVAADRRRSAPRGPTTGRSASSTTV